VVSQSENGSGTSAALQSSAVEGIKSIGLREMTRAQPVYDCGIREYNLKRTIVRGQEQVLPCHNANRQLIEAHRRKVGIEMVRTPVQSSAAICREDFPCLQPRERIKLGL
jgi:hypothetical protein